MDVRTITSDDEVALRSFACCARHRRNGALLVERQIRRCKALRRAVMHPRDRFIGVFDGAGLLACGYHRDEPGLNEHVGRPSRYVLFVAVANRAQATRQAGQRTSDLMVQAIHSDIARHAGGVEVIAARAHPRHLGSLELLRRNGYLPVFESPQPTDLLHVALL